jgi:hypothetical protein
MHVEGSTCHIFPFKLSQIFPTMLLPRVNHLRDCHACNEGTSSAEPSTEKTHLHVPNSFSQAPHNTSIKRTHYRTMANDQYSPLPAVQQLFDTAELLESVLFELPSKDLLLAQRVCKQWKLTIEGSRKLQQALFFRGITDGAVDCSCYKRDSGRRGLFAVRGRHPMPHGEGW